MRMINLLLGSVAAVGLASAGCSKSDKTPPPPQFPSASGGAVTVDLPKFITTFQDASPEVKGTATQVGFNIRYQKYEDALMALDKLANDPNVTEAQKKVVNELIDQVKKLAGAGAAAPAQ